MESRRFLSTTPRAGARESADILIVNAEDLLTLANSHGNPRTGKEMGELGIVRDGAVAIREGRIVAAWKTRDVTRTFRAGYVISAQDKVVLPGFVDPHPHLVFAGSREDEFQLRVEGASYMEIFGSGGAARTTSKET